MSTILQVVGRTSRQISQFRKGLKETGIWPLLIHRRDVIPVLFPRESEAQVTPQVQQQRHITTKIQTTGSIFTKGSLEFWLLFSWNTNIVRKDKSTKGPKNKIVLTTKGSLRKHYDWFISSTRSLSYKFSLNYCCKYWRIRFIPLVL